LSAHSDVFAEASADVRSVGQVLQRRFLGIGEILEGSVQRGGNRMRVNVQLIDAETGNHLWAERFDKPLADLLWSYANQNWNAGRERESAKYCCWSQNRRAVIVLDVSS
jgi:TolB-like protein